MEIVDRIAHALVSATEAARLNNRTDLLRHVGLTAAIARAEIPEARRDATLRALADLRN